MIASVLAVAIVGVGCSSESAEPPGYTKADFEKSGPPPEYKGPGQPGGPGSGPISGPPETGK